MLDHLSLLRGKSGGPRRKRQAADTQHRRAGRFGRFFQAMLEKGVYLDPSQFEAGFLSTTHDDLAINQTIAAAEAAFASI